MSNLKYYIYVIGYLLNIIALCFFITGLFTNQYGYYPLIFGWVLLLISLSIFYLKKRK